MSEKNRVYSAVLSTFFLLFLLIPLCLFLVVPHKDISEAEKRKLAVFPELRPDVKGLLAFPKQFNAFYQDHFGLRDSLIILLNTISLKIFRVAPAKFVVQGGEGWFFYISEGVINDYYGQRQEDLISLDKYTSIFADRRDWLARIGVRYLFVPVPNKITVYDEYLSDRIRRNRGVSFYEQLISFLEHETRFENVLDIYSLFQKNKWKKQLYFKTDTHWSNDGDLLAFNQIMEYCDKWFPEQGMKPLTEEDVSRNIVNFSGDLSRLMHQEKAVSEDVSIIRLKQPCASDENYHWPGSLQKLTVPLSDDPAVLPFENGCSQKKLTALVIHDSFGNHLRRYFNERFKKVIYSPHIQLNGLKELIVKENPDIVFEVWVARNILRIAHDPLVSSEVLEAKYAASDTVRLRIDKSLDMESVSDRNDVTLQRHADGLLIRAVGDDPFFAVPLIQPGNRERYIVEVELDSPVDTLFAFYFTIGEDTRTFVQEQMVEQKISKGSNRLLFRLPHPNVRGQVRIDPGKTAGDYLLRSLTVKVVEEKTAIFTAAETGNNLFTN